MENDFFIPSCEQDMSGATLINQGHALGICLRDRHRHIITESYYMPMGTEQQLERLDSRSAANTLKLVLAQRKHCCFEEKS